MSRFPLVLFIMFFLLVACRETQSQKVAHQAYQHTEKIVALGPRYPGSQGIERVRDFLRKEVSSMGFVMQEHRFDAQTPKGKITMNNLFYEIPGKYKKKIILGAHYDSKYMGSLEFVGANDAASSVGLLLALSEWFKSNPVDHTLQVVFFDGEEALGHRWSDEDSLYGSRAFVSQMVEKDQIHAVLVLDMISDPDLQLIRSQGSNEDLLKILENALIKISKPDLLEKKWSYIEDDHVPFIKAGIPTLHLMDFTFGGNQTPGVFWHTEKDDMQQVSKKSLQTMAQLMMILIPEISLRF